MLHKEILTDEQLGLLRFVSKFRRTYFLVGGTAIALHLGHRRSIDFDLFSQKPPNNKRISEKIMECNVQVNKIFVKKSHEFTLKINQVKFTFYHYTFPVSHRVDFNGIITMPSLLQLAAMKVHALGGRAKWKDYVDLYFIFKYHFSISDVSNEAKKLFKGEFNERLLRQQLHTFDDINYSEMPEFMNESISEDTIKSFLKKISTS